jgi:ADP-ribose pyrophosphatase YjhB (NUDIX family)
LFEYEQINKEPDWLRWTREIQAIAQCGLAFSSDVYDIERYIQLRKLASEMMADKTDTPVKRIIGLFASESGYATPKLEVRAAVFDEYRRILLVREVADNGRWSLPGGWADVNITPAENAVKEVREESGYEVRVIKLAGVYDHTKQGHPSIAFSCTKMFFVCEPLGMGTCDSIETSESRWFFRHEIPSDISPNRVLPHQIQRMFDHACNLTLLTDFD